MQRILLAALLALPLLPSAAFAQRPPNPNQAPPQMGITRAWEWLVARPGVIVAIVVIAALVAFMVMSRDKGKNT
jgi:uncharacterized protein involved in exopolysaccharide biosynthesis